MPTIDQNLGCSQGDTFDFTITMVPYADGTLPDLTGATAVWSMLDGNYSDATILLTKTDTRVGQDDAGNWQVIVGLEPEDTTDIPPGVYYHLCRVTLANGNVSHVEAGAFVLRGGIP